MSVVPVDLLFPSRFHFKRLVLKVGLIRCISLNLETDVLFNDKQNALFAFVRASLPLQLFEHSLFDTLQNWTGIKKMRFHLLPWDWMNWPSLFFSFWTIHNIADWEQSPQISSWWQRFPFHTMNSHRLLNSYCRDTIVVFEELTYWRLITRLVRRENCVSSNNRTEQFLSVFYLVTASNFLCFCFYWIFSMSTGLLTY